MSNKDIFMVFKDMFPFYIPDVQMWFPNGKNSIRVRMDNNSERMFTYNNDKDWRLETAKSYFKENKKGE